MKTSWRNSLLKTAIGGATLAAAVSLAPSQASAQSTFGERLALHIELGGGLMAPPYQQTNLGMQGLVEGHLRFGLTIVGPLAFQASVGQWLFFPGANGFGGILTVAGGLRFEPMLGKAGRLFIDGNAGVAFTGPLTRFGFDVGLGFEFQVGKIFGIGPMVRYGHVVHAPDVDFPSDAQHIAFGISATFRGAAPDKPKDPDPLPPPRPGDRDRDGVVDEDDLCPDIPQGESPDPSRKGCPEPDSDSDGVLDSKDQCVSTPKGDHPDPDKLGCPDGDDDADSVLNHDDQCRTEPQGLYPDPARAGCPAPDRDHDSVRDEVDHCPDQPGAPSTDPVKNGCPSVLLVDHGQLRILQQVFFATNRDVILPRSFPVLQAVADALKALPEIKKIEIGGHTDDVGNDAKNLDLSQRRANSVMAYLAAQGIDAGRMSARGYGETAPKTPPAGLRGRALRDARSANRRVEFNITDPPQGNQGH